MLSISCHKCTGFIVCLIFALTVATSLMAAADEQTLQDQGLDSTMSGFIELVRNLDDISTTVTEIPAPDSKSAPLSGRIMYSKSENMLSFEILNNPFLEGLMIIIDNKEETVYLLSPSSDEVIKMSAEVAAAQLTGMGIGNGHSSSLMAAFEELLPVDILSNFELQPLGQTSEGDKSYYLIKMTPKSEAGEEKADENSYSVVWIDTATYYLCRIEQFSRDKSSGAFVLTDSLYNAGLARSDFIAPLQGKSIVNY